ncbi:MAG: class I SAM-dependent methyltransferase [Promethearchaeota archaeon]
MKIDNFKETLGERFSRDAEFLNLLVDKLNLPEDSNVLDVGTGRGIMAIVLALHGYKVITGEPEGTFWADWRSSAKKVGVEELIEFKSLNAEDLIFEDNVFDVIFLYATFHHIGNKKRAFSELIRVLKLKGLLAIIELTDEGVEVVRETFKHHPDAEDPRDYIKDPNLQVEVIESKYLNAYLYRRK